MSSVLLIRSLLYTYLAGEVFPESCFSYINSSEKHLEMSTRHLFAMHCIVQ